MATFPQSFKEVLDNSNIPMSEIAKSVNIPKRRFWDIVGGRCKMDHVEYMDIKLLVERLKKANE